MTGTPKEKAEQLVGSIVAITKDYPMAIKLAILTAEEVKHDAEGDVNQHWAGVLSALKEIQGQ